mmetsp:Transcript_2755/g.7586  ORF Transcript_2755/g.7586 Transcript_2755/m.7586 type:complete len:94 (+) Transcript_2755:1270-1551(+)
MSEENPQKIDDCDACSVKTLEYIRGKLRLAVHGGNTLRNLAENIRKEGTTQRLPFVQHRDCHSLQSTLADLKLLVATKCSTMASGMCACDSPN